MQKTIIELPDGTLISSGSNTVNAIKSCTITESVNVGTDLEPGSTYANKLKVEMFTPDGNLSIGANQEVTVYKESDGVREKAGIFILEKPTRPTANTMKLSAFDRVTKLDKELAPWLNGLSGWPYNIHIFAAMVCAQCGLVYKQNATPNGEFLVYQFARSSVTGRQIMQWIGQILCRFCRATPDGEIEFAWYTPTDIQIAATEGLYYFQGGLIYENYDVEPVDAVQIRLADSSEGALWPVASVGSNTYIISGNAILNARITDALLPYLEVIKGELGGLSYKPCRVKIPSAPEIRAGSIVHITDKNGVQVKTLVMTKTQSGQADTLECTGNLRRDSAASINNQSVTSKAESAAQNAFNGLTPEQVLNKLTDNGKIQGIYQQNGRWYINAELVQVINLVATNIVAGILKSRDGLSYFDLDSGEFVASSENGMTVKMKYGQVYVERPDGGVGVGLERVADGGYAVMLRDNSGNHKGGLQSNDDGLWLWTVSQDDGDVHGRKIGFKQITYTDPNGIPHMIDVLCTY